MAGYPRSNFLIIIYMLYHGPPKGMVKLLVMCPLYICYLGHMKIPEDKPELYNWTEITGQHTFNI